MPLKNVKRDGNVPFIGPRSRYSIIGVKTTAISQKMAAGESFDGNRPQTQSKNADELDPFVKAGSARWEELIEGGLFDLLGNRLEAITVEHVENPAGATLEIVARDGTTVLRQVPSETPFQLAPGEVLRATGGSDGGEVKFFARIQGNRIL